MKITDLKENQVVHCKTAVSGSGSDLPKGDWWCNDCQRYINTVTYEEKCVHCGSEDVEWHLEDGTVVK